MGTAGIFQPVRERLLSRINRVDSGCWEWTGCLSDTGYGNISCYGRLMGAHRASYIEFNGEIPPGKLVCHKCDNRKCINPEHLFLGTYLENIHDTKSKGRLRSRWQNGERHNRAKLNPKKVRMIMSLLGRGRSLSSIAREFNVYPTAISMIRDGKTWKTITAASSHGTL